MNRRPVIGPKLGRAPDKTLMERGDTLIEILISLLILSGTVVALMTAFSTSISASSRYRGLVVSDTVLRAVSEQVIGQFQQGSTYQSCATASQYSTLLSPSLVVPSPYASANYVVSVTGVQFWSGANYGTSCTSGSQVPQLITLQVAGPLSESTPTSFVVEGSNQIMSSSATQLNVPTNVTTATPSGDSGGLTVNFVGSSNAPANSASFTQYYTVKACTDSAMSQGCVAISNQFQPGQELQGLVPGTQYWVTVLADASPGYLASSSTSPVAGTSSGTLSLPAVLSVTSSTTTSGALVVTFRSPSDAPSGDTFTATACTNSSMTASCVVQSNFSSGSQITGLTSRTSYFVEIAADSKGTYPGASSLPYSPAVMATAQLSVPTGLTVTSSTVQTGALVVSFTGVDNPPPTGQAYQVTGCTDSAMTANCVTQSPFVSGSQFTGLTPGSSYFITVTASASTGYLGSVTPVSTPATQATIQLSQPVVKKFDNNRISAGQVKITFNGSSNGPATQKYTLIGCNDSAMTLNCLTFSNYVSTTAVGTWAASSTVYVTITANASTGYLASTPSTQMSGTAG